MLSGHPKYKKVTLPLSATFVSKSKGLRIYLEPVEEKVGINETISRVPNTGLRVKFEDNRLIVKNKLVFEKLLKCKNFNSPKSGFFVDVEDPTGFWRAIGRVETEKITVGKDKPHVDIKLTQDWIGKLEKFDTEELEEVRVFV